MTEFKAKSTETLIFNLTQNDNFVAKLTYKNWLSFKATVLFADKSIVEFEPTGFWKTNIEIKKEGNTIIKMKMNWDSEDVLITSFENIEQEFLFKYTGTLKEDTFVLTNENNQKIVSITPDNKWENENYEYKIVTVDEFNDLKNKDILLMACVYLTNSYITTILATLSATM